MSLYYEGGTVLHRLNPLTKLALSLVAVAHMIAFPDLWPILTHVALGALLVLYARPKLPRELWLGILTLLIGHAWVNAVLYGGDTVLLDLRIVRISAEGLVFGAKLAARVLAIVLYSIAVASTTNPRDLAVSISRQLGVNYRYAFAAFVTFRMAPLVSRDLENILLSRKMRGWKQRSPVAAVASVLAPLLALVAKRSVTMSLSMESRGFGAYKDRTYYRDVKVTRADYLAIAAYALYLVAATVILHFIGLLGKPFELSD